MSQKSGLCIADHRSLSMLPALPVLALSLPGLICFSCRRALQTAAASESLPCPKALNYRSVQWAIVSSPNPHHQPCTVFILGS